MFLRGLSYLNFFDTGFVRVLEIDILLEEEYGAVLTTHEKSLWEWVNALNGELLNSRGSSKNRFEFARRLEEKNLTHIGTNNHVSIWEDAVW